jgi:Hydantoinase/oxoprolinase N-terminal region.
MVERVAVDVGGTFTDVLAYEKGEFFALKVPTTKPPELGVLKAVTRSVLRPKAFTTRRRLRQTRYSLVNTEKFALLQQKAFVTF